MNWNAWLFSPEDGKNLSRAEHDIDGGTDQSEGLKSSAGNRNHECVLLVERLEAQYAAIPDHQDVDEDAVESI